MYTDISITTACAVSKEFLALVAHQFPDNLVDANNTPKVKDTLHFLGFRTAGVHDINHKVDVLVRDNKLPSRVYSTDVYIGRLRNNLTKKGEDGKLLFNFLFDLYSREGVVQPKDLHNKDYKDILEIGSLFNYNKERK